MLSSLIPVYKCKGDPLNKNSYRGIKLLEQVFKLYERVLDKRLREIVGKDKMQYSFMPGGRTTVDAVSVFRRLTEKIKSRRKRLFYVFIDPGKAFE